MSYAANKGLGGGADANYIINDRNAATVRLYGNPKDGLFGGVTHKYAFGDEVVSGNASDIDFFLQPHFRRFELEATLSSRERINYQRVSQLPNLIFRTHGGELPAKLAKFDLELDAGEIAEEGNTRLRREAAGLKVYNQLPAPGLDSLVPFLALDSSFYSNGGRWVKPSLGLDLAKRFLPICH